jgi:GT2 family glycosyltransferase
MKKVGIVILNYKVKKEVLHCVQSVQKSDYKNIQIIVVDNNSSDGIEAEIAEMKEVLFLQTSGNFGYSGGNNFGIQEMLKQNADFIFVLNPDTEIEKTTISKLIAGMEKYDADLAGPKIYFSDKKTIWYAGGILDLNNVLGSHRGVDKKDDGSFDKTLDTDFASGGAIMIKRSVFEKIGLFDEKYFLYYEDSDFCFRAKKAGFKVKFIPDAVVFHDNAKSTGLGSPLQDYFITRNRMYFASKFLPLRTRFALFREALRNFSSPARRLALFDFWLGKLGKGSFIK